MCHAVRVKLSPEERAYTRRLTGILVPVYATVVLAIITLATITSGPRPGDLVASTTEPAAAPH